MQIDQQSKLWDGAHSAFFLTDDGTITGNTSMVVDGSVTPQYFWHTVPDNHTFYVHSIQGIIADSAKLQAAGFGSGVNPLTNGLMPVYRMSSLDDWTELPDGMHVFANTDFAKYGGGLDIFTFGTSDEVFTWRYAFIEDGLPQKFPAGLQVGYKIQDDLTTGIVNAMTMRVNGVLINNDYL